MKRILVVDDHGGFRTEISKLISLVQPQAQILQAQNGREGLDLARSERPDLILLDVNMPLMDGYETARALNALPETRTIPLIAMTLSGSEHSATLDHLRPFCRSVLLKPFGAAQLGAALYPQT
ncbi:MAG: response regulator [Chloroflexi bacterium]|nr:response regulator [Chloroflexota bacterium]